MKPPAWTKENSLVEADSLPEIGAGGNAADLRQAALRSVLYLERKGEEYISFGARRVRRSDAAASYRRLAEFLAHNPPDSELDMYIKRHFIPYRSSARSVLYTGYYVPVLHGSLKRTARFKFPIYGTPEDLVSIELAPDIARALPSDTPVINRGRLSGKTVFIPYYSREEIDSGRALEGRQLEILWVDDPVALFFLHIQGSGIIELSDGRGLTVGYADKNGRPYVAIGKTLLEKGALEKGGVNMFTIKEYLARHPEERDEILYSNPSYCFFRKLSGPPVGSLGVPVTAGYSIATDSSIFPPGALAVVQTAGIAHPAFNQDTGGAIRGPGRADIFLGGGTDAERKAGLMQDQGSLFFLAPKDGADQKGLK